MSTEQMVETLAWMKRTRPNAAAMPGVLIDLGGVSAFRYAVVRPDGSYQTVKLGKLHPKPKVPDA